MIFYLLAGFGMVLGLIGAALQHNWLACFWIVIAAIWMTNSAIREWTVNLMERYK